MCTAYYHIIRSIFGDGQRPSEAMSIFASFSMHSAHLFCISPGPRTCRPVTTEKRLQHCLLVGTDCCRLHLQLGHHGGSCTPGLHTCSDLTNVRRHARARTEHTGSCRSIDGSMANERGLPPTFCARTLRPELARSRLCTIAPLVPCCAAVEAPRAGLTANWHASLPRPAVCGPL